MTLLELLVQELPKRGGWPDENYKFGNYALVQGHQGAIYRAGGGDFLCTLEKADDWEVAEVSRVQYEAALAASQNVEWDGTGLPPIGIEFEMSYRDNDDWKKCVLIAHGEEQIIYKYDGETEFSGHRSNYQFRPTPIRSEADKKRDGIIDALANFTLRGDAGDIYRAIVAGKIPGVRIE